MEDNKLLSKKKPAFPVSEMLNDYLTTHSRNIKIPIYYEDLLRFQGAVEIFDEDGNDTLWISTYFAEHERQEIEISLKKMYTILHADGSEAMLEFLAVDAIDFCTFGNTKPFRVKIRNILNDNYTYLYIKKADASRIYGLELEDMLSPNHINYLVHKDSLIEEHILGISGDYFIKHHLEKCSFQDKMQIVKEFVKFNERCFVRLLGDMRSYNYVFVLTNDFDRIQYRIRAIDFDQQSYEGKSKVYKPQFFKENFPLVELTLSMLKEESIEQYKIEERSLIAKRASSEKERLDSLLNCMKNDIISKPKKIEQLKNDLFEITKDVRFKKAKNMGKLLETALDFVMRNYKNINPYVIR